VARAWVLRDETSPQADLLIEDIAATAVSMVVPALWWYEMANLLRSAVLRNRLEKNAARSAYLGLHDIMIDTIDPLRQGRSGILAASLDFGLSAYDATYLHLAQAIGADLLTADSHLLALTDRVPCIKDIREYLSP
jgi:predicted nucleic acid-binding protein